MRQGRSGAQNATGDRQPLALAAGSSDGLRSANPEVDRCGAVVDRRGVDRVGPCSDLARTSVPDRVRGVAGSTVRRPIAVLDRSVTSIAGQLDVASVQGDTAADGVEQRRLAGSAGTGRERAIRRGRRVDRPDPSARGRDRPRLPRRCAASAWSARCRQHVDRSVRGRRRGEQLAELVGCIGTGLRGVEPRRPPDRRRALRRGQQDDECRLQRHVADAEAVADRDRDEATDSIANSSIAAADRNLARGVHDSDPVLLGHGAPVAPALA